MLDKTTNRLFTLSVAILIFIIGYKTGQTNLVYKVTKKPLYQLVTNQKNPENLDFKLFWDVWEKLDEKYVDKSKLNTQARYYGAIKGMVASIGDPYTFFLSPEENKQSKEDLSGKLEGIGAQLGLRNGAIVIIAPLKNSPAQKAGVTSGDIITKVNGVSTVNWNLQQAISKIRGPKGTTVKLTLLRDKKEFEIIIIRQQIIIPTIELSYEKNIAILKLSQFGDNLMSEWDKAIGEINSNYQKGQIKGLVLDLRDNPGGYLEGSIYITSDFLPLNSLIVKQQYANNSSTDYKSSRSPRLLNIPLIVIINEGSASASEIVAGALRDYDRTILVGKKSFGKGSIQEAIDLNGYAGLHVTIAKWILPKGDWINSKGINPKYEVQNEVDENNSPTRQSDKQLDKAIELLIK